MKIALLASGGVDSSVALKLLQAAGHKLSVFYLKIWLEDELNFLKNCPWQEDLEYLQPICKQAGFKLQIISLQKEYWQEVISYTISELKSGRTPNPDILCNQKIKFGKFFDHINSNFQKVATGHYAQTIKKNDLSFLQKSPDPVKDQTYFLAHLNQKQISRALFPIGHLKKSGVRNLAKKFALPNQNRKDSQGICFLGKFQFKEFVRRHLGIKPGHLIEFETGKKIATHQGYWFFTLGQRQGLGLSGGPWYVVKKNIADNIVYISRNYFSPDKQRNNFEVTEINWISGLPSSFNNLSVKIRHGVTEYPCELELTNSKQGSVKISAQDQGISPGQYAVFYQNNLCLGSGIISS